MAFKWFLSSVNSIVCVKVIFLIKRFSTNSTAIRFFSLKLKELLKQLTWANNKFNLQCESSDVF